MAGARSGRWRTVVQIAISALALWLIARNVDVAQTATLLTTVRVPLLLAAIVLYAAGQVLSAYRWWLIGHAVGLTDSFVRYVRFYFVGMFFMVFGPSTLGGDVVRSLYLAEDTGRRALAFNSVLFDRLNGLVVLVAIGAVSFLLFPQYELPLPLFYATVGFGSALFLAWCLAPLLVRVLPRTHRVRRFIEDELGAFWSDRRMLVATTAVSIVFHLLQIGIQWLVARSLGLAVPFTYVCVFHPLVSALSALPITFSGIGLREGGYVFFLTRIGIDQASALAFGALWLMVLITNTLLGGIVFVLSGARLPRLTRDG
jgi:glycosyltransferase 2 family protein